tara:strand:+ start:2888 stop:3433 length:546 start_codon:yes stop_codon:yes gene_type:complete
MGINHHTLKTRHREERDSYPDNLSLRVHRAFSWLNRAEQEDDPDSRFIFLWIAFNAAYATDIDDREGLSEQRTFNAFLEKLHELCGQRSDLERLPQRHPRLAGQPLRLSLLLFWDCQRNFKTEGRWWDSFTAAKRAATAPWPNRTPPAPRPRQRPQFIYTLCNQLLHGGATRNSRPNPRLR